MERIMDVDERIRRAEELYNRRKMQGGVRVSTNNVNNSSRTKASMFKKMVIKLIICTIIYLIFYILKNSGMFFSKNVIDQTKKIISYDINFNYMYSQAIKMYSENIVAKFDNTQNKEGEQNISNLEQGEIQENTESNQQENDSGTLENNVVDNDEQKSENNQEELGIGGGDESNSSVDIVNSGPAQVAVIQKTQMEIDAEYIKSNYSFIKPVQGIVTSRFGPRTPTSVISANHKGIDIGANTGTEIYAAMEGTVTKVSTYGDYGKHFCIKNGDVVTLYAHCNKINVSVGQTIKQGQKVAKVGSTGRTTGPHLHFEIQREGRVINPEYVLEF